MGNSAWRRRIERSEIAVVERGVLSQTIAAQSVVLPQRGDRRADVGKTSVAYGLWWIVGGERKQTRDCVKVFQKK